MNRKCMGLMGNIGRVGAAAGWAVSAFGATGCDDNKPAANIAPTSSALAAPKPAAMGAMTFAVDKASTKVDFSMEAPQEKIRGRVPNATTGDLSVNMEDITKSTGLLTVDISGI